jgi:hypothetical protein
MSVTDTIVSIIGLAPWAGATIVATILVTGRLCRYQMARQKRPSLGTMFTGACCIPLLLVVVGTILDQEMWWPRLHKGTPGDLLFLLSCVAMLCFLTAPSVVR